MPKVHLGRGGVPTTKLNLWMDARTLERIDAIVARHRRWTRRDVIDEAVALLYDAEFPALVSDEAETERVA